MVVLVRMLVVWMDALLVVVMVDEKDASLVVD